MTAKQNNKKKYMDLSNKSELFSVWT